MTNIIDIGDLKNVKHCKLLRIFYVPSDEESDVPSDFSFSKTTDESRWETDEVINSPPEPKRASSPVTK